MFTAVRLGLLLSLSVLVSAANAADRPNVLWITAEDMSPVLGCYGDEQAITPNIDALAEKSVRYTHAFASAPVCSPARSCLITGCYATSLGTQQMRSAFPIPEEMTGFPSYIREAGYYTSNNVKTDYNTANWDKIIEASWNESSATAHWRNREDKSKPFFSVFNLMTSHQSRSMVWDEATFKKDVQSRLSAGEIHDPARMVIPPYYPDTPVVRRTLARFYDCVTAMDQEVGKILKQLEEDGLAEDTIVFFFADHGTGLPRHKRALLDSGMHVPLLVKFPKKWEHLAPNDPGKTTKRLVSFVDFAPTVLSLIGIDIPDYMQGEAFLGHSRGAARRYAFGHRDRVDEVRDMSRSVRSRKYLYIRNYMPHLSYNQPTSWPDLGLIRHEFYRRTDKEGMSDGQWHFAGKGKPVEELYDCEADPMNLNNLVESEAHATVVEEMRTAHREHIRSSMDVGFVAESDAWKLFDKSTPWEVARGRELDFESVYEAAVQVGVGDEYAHMDNMRHVNESVRYWGAIGLAARETLSRKARKDLMLALYDESWAVRIEAAASLVRVGEGVEGLPVLQEALESDNMTVVLHAARTVEMLGDKAADLKPQMKMASGLADKLRPSNAPATFVQVGDPDLAMFISFSANAFIANLERQWRPLISPGSLDGWKALTEGDVTIEGKEVVLKSKGKNLWVLHKDVLKDFELEGEVMMPAEGYNSGIGFRCSPKGAKPIGYQAEIENQKTGMIYAIGSGWVWPKGKEEGEMFKKMAEGAFVKKTWNHIRLRCEGDHIQIWVNGVLTADVKDSRFKEGQIALQHHGKGDEHRFRMLRVRDL